MINHKLLATISKSLFILCACFLSKPAQAQCAGTDGSVIVCTKDADEANKTFALFPHLQGTPSPGGAWSTNDPANFFALDRTNGIVNLWEVKNSGLHEFTYTNNACGESAMVTISLGGYPGEDNIDAAIALTVLNAENFPESDYTQFALGEFYAATGQVSPALEHYARAVELKPSNERFIGPKIKALQEESNLLSN